MLQTGDCRINQKFLMKGYAVIDREKLLQIKEVIEEVNRHKWIQSEMAGFDIGFNKAADDWFQKHATAWVAFHNPQPAVKGVKAKGKK